MLKNAVNPAIAGVVITIVLVLVVLFLGWEYLGPRTDGPKEPIDMGKMMGKAKVAPPTTKGGPINMGAPKQP